VLHGNRQTGELLLSRMDKLRKKILKERGYELVAIDAPHMHSEDDPLLRTWWKTRETSEGLDDTLRALCETWDGDSKGKHNERSSGSSSSSSNHRDVGSVEVDSSPPFCGVLGFSQGARLAHLMAVLHEHGRRRPPNRPNDDDDADHDDRWFPGLTFVILAAGYDAPLPDVVRELLVPPVPIDDDHQPTIHKVASLHVWGEADKLIPPQQSRQLSLRYRNPTIHVHDGGHHVPMRAANIQAYLDFVVTLHGTGSAASSSVEASPLEEAASVRPSGSVVDGVERLSVSSSASQQPASHKADRNVEASRLPTTKATTTTMTKDTTTTAEPNGILATTTEPPDPDNLQAQLDELEAIQAIYPDEFRLQTKSRPPSAINEATFNDFPIRYEVDLVRADDDDPVAWWPPRPIAVGVTYPHTYPLERGPIVRLVHANNVMELATAQAEQCLGEMQHAAQLEQGMCCVLSCIQAAREYFESGRARQQVRTNRDDAPSILSTQSRDESDAPNEPTTAQVSKIQPSSKARIDECNVQGLSVAESVLKAHNCNSADRQVPRGGKGGSWTYTIGLVGKPSVRVSLYLLAERTLITSAHPALSQRLSGGKVHVLQRGDGVRSAAR
jgi:Serine hydrolase (FSH1)/RWD domain